MTGLDDQGYVSNIQSFSVNDGEGIRTNIFLAGCPLRCRWCANPETWLLQPRIGFFQEKCIGCGACIRSCPNQAINQDNFFSNEKCTVCGLCVNNCPVDARKIMGRQMSVREVIDQVRKDLIFFRESGGGVTFSGGEPTFQKGFLSALVEGHAGIGVEMAIETSGYFVWSEVEHIFRKIDLIFIDIKHMDPFKHFELTGVRNELILDNIRKLGRMDKAVVVRIPLIKGINSDVKNITKTACYVRQYVPGGKIELLPYHSYGVHKYDILGIPQYKNIFQAPAQADIDLLKDVIEGKGVELADYK